jgi:hypothetical protein
MVLPLEGLVNITFEKLTVILGLVDVEVAVTIDAVPEVAW